MNTDVMFSSEKTDWGTPQYFFDYLNSEFNFNLDVCANKLNHKCKYYFSPKDNGLKQHWEGVVFMNPPYGDEAPNWIEKAYKESQKGCTVICLIASRTDTKSWHNFVMKAHEIRFIKGRLKFEGAENGAPFPSAVVVFKPGKKTTKISTINLKEVKEAV